MMAGYAVMATVIVIVAIHAIDVSLFGSVKHVTIFNVGPVWFRVSLNGPLYENMRKLGFRIKKRGDWAFGMSLPGWVGRMLRKRGQDRTT